MTNLPTRISENLPAAIHLIGSVSGCLGVAEIVATVFDEHWKLKWSCLLEVTSFAGQDCQECAPTPHFWQLLTMGFAEAGGVVGNFLMVVDCYTASRKLSRELHNFLQATAFLILM